MARRRDAPALPPRASRGAAARRDSARSILSQSPGPSLSIAPVPQLLFTAEANRQAVNNASSGLPPTLVARAVHPGMVGTNMCVARPRATSRDLARPRVTSRNLARPRAARLGTFTTSKPTTLVCLRLLPTSGIRATSHGRLASLPRRACSRRRRGRGRRSTRPSRRPPPRAAATLITLTRADASSRAPPRAILSCSGACGTFRWTRCAPISRRSSRWPPWAASAGAREAGIAQTAPRVWLGPIAARACRVARAIFTACRVRPTDARHLAGHAWCSADVRRGPRPQCCTAAWLHGCTGAPVLLFRSARARVA